MSGLDTIVLVVYCAAVAFIGIWLGGRQRNEDDFFLGSNSLPWWALCFSVVATETSTLTVIGVPAVAYGGSLTFLQLTIGYVLGRGVVAAVLLPRYFRGEMKTAYAYLGSRFGSGMRSTASVTFLVTRLLADGVRLFATAIPLKLILAASGWDASYGTIIVLIGLVTIAYTLVGGIKAVVWMDVVQMAVYVGGAVIAVVLLSNQLGDGWLTAARDAGKTKLIDLGSSLPIRSLLTSPYAFVTAVIGGGVLSIASHGTDQLVVQRLLSCRSLADGQRAVVVSGFVVAAQFGLFLVLGLMLWAHYGPDLQSIGLSRGDEVFPYYIINEMPTGLAGLLIAGILAAAMSTLSSSLNALASSTLFDLGTTLRKIPGMQALSDLQFGRLATAVWGIVFMIFASLFTDRENSVVELGLSIASFTYGGLLGAFVLGIVNRKATQTDAIVALLATLVTMSVIITWVAISPNDPLDFTLASQGNALRDNGWTGLAWPWYPLLGTTISVLVGSTLALRHR